MISFPLFASSFGKFFQDVKAAFGQAAGGSSASSGSTSASSSAGAPQFIQEDSKAGSNRSLWGNLVHGAQQSVRGVYQGAQNVFQGAVSYGKKLLAGFNWSGLLERARSLARSSGHMCARGVRMALNVLTGKNISNGPSACKYDLSRMRQWGQYVQVALNKVFPLQAGDVISCSNRTGCDPANGKHGHIEMVTPEGVISDFQQKGPICLTGNYSNPKVFRMAGNAEPGTQLNTFLKKIYQSNWAFASSERGLLDDGMYLEDLDNSSYYRWPERIKNLGRIGAWEFEYLEEEEKLAKANHYKIWKYEEGKKTLLVEDYTGFFYALESIEEKEVQKEFAQRYLRERVKQEGFVRVQNLISRLIALQPLQKEAYLDEGFELPEFYTLLNK